MNKNVQLLLTGALTAILGAASTAQAAPKWQEIAVPDAITVTLADGSTRDVKPSCSGGPKLANPDAGPAGGIVSADTDFSFFVQRGNPNRVLVFLDGGGACWDANTCIGSPLFGDSSYTQEINETSENLSQAGGILDAKNSKNPYRNYTKVYVPYCSGDIHYGSRDTSYTLATPFGPISWEIRHRGADNLLATLDIIRNLGRKDGGVDLSRAKDVTVTGVSAGGYGATLAFGYVAEETRKKARLNLISDAAIGVQTPDFYRDVIYNPAAPGTESWGVADNLPTWVPAFADPDAFLSAAAGNPSVFQPLLFTALADYRPRAKLASLTTNLDLVQVGFYGITRPGVDPTQVAGEWYFAMDAITDATAANANYRFFIEDGTSHTFLASDSLFYGVGANGVSIRDWVNAMIKPGNRAWDNLDAGAPF